MHISKHNMLLCHTPTRGCLRSSTTPRLQDRIGLAMTIILAVSLDRRGDPIRLRRSPSSDDACKRLHRQPRRSAERGRRSCARSDEVLPASQAMGARSRSRISTADLGESRMDNVFERYVLRVDKIDSDRPPGTLVPGSLTSSLVRLSQSAGLSRALRYRRAPAVRACRRPAVSTAVFNRSIRLATDFRHIATSRWTPGSDVRGRMVNDPRSTTAAAFTRRNHTTVEFRLPLQETIARESRTVAGPQRARSDVFSSAPVRCPTRRRQMTACCASTTRVSASSTLSRFGGLYTDDTPNPRIALDRHLLTSRCRSTRRPTAAARRRAFHRAAGSAASQPHPRRLLLVRRRCSRAAFVG